MEKELLIKEKNNLINKYGKWTAHNIKLADDVYTIDNKPCGSVMRFKRVLDMVSVINSKPLKNLRILDLGCLEGGFSIEFGLHGASVVGIEGRKANIEKALFSKKVLGLTNVKFILDDVRNISIKKYGQFDIVLCLGILYHLDSSDIILLLKNIYEMVTKFVIIDTHISFISNNTFDFNGKKYFGNYYIEHTGNTKSKNILEKSYRSNPKILWSSLNNVKSFWPTLPSLYNLLLELGFISVFMYIINPHPLMLDRINLIVFKSVNDKMLSNDFLLSKPPWDEKIKYSLNKTD